jgi:hypothetical protein
LAKRRLAKEQEKGQAVYYVQYTISPESISPTAFHGVWPFPPSMGVTLFAVMSPSFTATYSQRISNITDSNFGALQNVYESVNAAA